MSRAATTLDSPVGQRRILPGREGRIYTASALAYNFPRVITGGTRTEPIFITYPPPTAPTSMSRTINGSSGGAGVTSSSSLSPSTVSPISQRTMFPSPHFLVGTTTSFTSPGIVRSAQTSLPPPWSSPAPSLGKTRKFDNEDSSYERKLTPRSISSKSRSRVSINSLASEKEKARSAQRENDKMVYLDGPQVYTCAQCRTHLTSHDDIISKSFHGRHGRAYLFDQCVNVTIGPAEDRMLITGLHSVNDIFCKRCKNMVGWTYSRAYEQSQKYKEGKFIIEKINLYLEDSSNYEIDPPAGERCDKWRKRSMSWGSSSSGNSHHCPSSPRWTSPSFILLSPPASISPSWYHDDGDTSHHNRTQTVYEYSHKYPHHLPPPPQLPFPGSGGNGSY